MADEDEPGLVLQRIEGLGSKRVAFHQLDGDGQRAGPCREDADGRHAVVGCHIDVRQIVEAFREALVDGDGHRAAGLDYLAEGREGRLRQRHGTQHQRDPKSFSLGWRFTSL